MKIKNIIASVLLTLGAGTGLTIGISSLTTAEHKEIIEVEAASNKTIYFVPSSEWKEANAVFYGWRWGGTVADSWINFLDTDNDGFYEASMPDDSTDLIIVRKNPSNNKPDWSGEWNRVQTKVTNDNNVFYVYGWNTSNEWKNTDYFTAIKSPAQSSSTLGLFLNRQGSWHDGEHLLHYWNQNGSINKLVKPAEYSKRFSSADGTVEFGSKEYDNYLVYYNVDKDIVGCNIQFKPYKDKISAGSSHDTKYDIDITGAVSKFEAGMNAEMFYINYDSNAQAYLTKGTNESGITLTDATIFKKVLGSYFTCDSDPSNGYGNAETLYNTWIKHGETTFIDESILKDVVLDDYAYDEITEKYDYSGSKTTEYTTAFDKIQRMLSEQRKAQGVNSLSNNLLKHLGTENSNVMLIIIVSSISLVCAFAILIKFRKKEENK